MPSPISSLEVVNHPESLQVSAAPSRSATWLVGTALAIGFLILLFVGGMMWWVMKVQLGAEESGLSAAMATAPPNHAAALAYTRAITATVAKTSSLYLAFLLIFLGGVYVLIPNQVVYKAQGTGLKV